MKDDNSKDLRPVDAHDGASMSNSFSRRGFLQMVGGGIIVFYSTSPVALAQERGSRESRYPTDFNAYVRIGEDGRVTCFVGKIEMGQGIITGLAQMCADELDVSLDSVDMVMGDTALCPFDFMTVGSRTTRDTGPRLRRAVAEARSVLLLLAAEKLELPEDRLDTNDGFVFDKNNPANKVSYASLTEGKQIERRLEGEPEVEPLAEHTVCGVEYDRTDGRVKVTGEAKFSGDIRVDGMLCARILRPPAHGATLLSADTSAAQKIPGVQVVREGELVAVLHEHFDIADRALSTVKAEFREPEATLDNDNIHAHLIGIAPEGEVVEEKGNLAAGEKLATSVFERVYCNGYVAHAPMEPHTAVADVKGNKATVWASTQGPFSLKDQVAASLGFPAENVRVITPFVGGGYGGKSRGQQALEAATLSKLAGKPVQVAWTREEEFMYDTFMPAAAVRIRSGLNDANQIVFWDYVAYFCGSRSSEPFYAIPHYRVVSRGNWGGRGPAGPAHPFGVGAWRGPGSNSNNFARESHIDLMATAAGMDPVEFRLLNLTDKRMIRVLKAAAEKFSWTSAPTPSGRGHGVICENYVDTRVSTIAEVAVDRQTGGVKVKRIVCAQDMGECVNPAGAHAQISGGITMGLGFALSEEIDFKGGKVLTRNYDTYNITRFSWTPEFETIVIDNKVDPPSGGGEPAITTTGAVIANAVHDALGVELLRLPLTPARLKAALNAGK
ncbi:MAG TPA: molybdopterin cofactor-binding domain-containing protein [Acidobacteriota bacterium]|nr:molybdopterin cofactor-binding domain-containing protein [Acidobacteriota bacterium]